MDELNWSPSMKFGTYYLFKKIQGWNQTILTNLEMTLATSNHKNAVFDPSKCQIIHLRKTYVTKMRKTCLNTNTNKKGWDTLTQIKKINKKQFNHII